MQIAGRKILNIFLTCVAILLFAVSVYSVYAAWQSGIEQSRLETTSRLLAVRTSPRVSETPGINSWVVSTLLDTNMISGEKADRLKRFVLPSSAVSMPGEFAGVTDALRNAQPLEVDVIEVGHAFFQPDPNRNVMQFRELRVFESENVYLIETAKRGSSVADVSAKLLIGVKKLLGTLATKPVAINIPKLDSGRIARIYLVDESLSFTSLPTGSNDEETIEEIVKSEISELKKNSRSPTFATNEFFFRFEFDRPIEAQATYSGVYLDQGGLGLVATIAVPRLIGGTRYVVAADVVFDVPWSEIIAGHSPVLLGEVVEIDKPNEPFWAPWNSFKSAMLNRNSELHLAVEQLAKFESINAASVDRKSVYHASAVEGKDVVAIQVSRSSWILLLIKKSTRAFPWWTIGFSSIFFAILIGRIEFSRRHAIGLQHDASRELNEKQNLLNTMQVPLMVVDPNTDEIVFCNEAANKIGMQPKMTFANDILSGTDAAQARYRDMQVFSDESRRAYGVPIRIRERQKEGGIQETERYAIVRSVGVTAPIRALNADERHRLGILFVLNEEFDLQILMNEFENQIATSEKRLLAGLMNHGIDTLCRVLSEHLSVLVQDSNEKNTEFVDWLAKYLSQRISVVAWILENWGSEPRIHEQRILTRRSVENTIARFQTLFQLAGKNRTIREQLHWNNGLLSGNSRDNDQGAVINSKFDWSDEYVFQIPIDGSFGFFIGEALVNAVRHGLPGSTLRFSITHDSARNELFFRLTNQVDVNKIGEAVGGNVPGHKPYGGFEIMKEIARFSGWSEPRLTIDKGIAELSWSINSIQRKIDSEVD